MKLTIRCVAFALLLAILASSAQGQNKKKDAGEDDYYKLLRFDIPPGEVLEAGALEIMPDGKVAVGTRRGEVWMIDNAYADDPKQARFNRFAHGLHEILGLAQKDGWLYVTHRPDVSRIKDTNGDGKADLFEVVTDDWEINGDYHEYAFGSRFDKAGNLWIGGAGNQTGHRRDDRPISGGHERRRRVDPYAGRGCRTWSAPFYEGC